MPYNQYGEWYDENTTPAIDFSPYQSEDYYTETPNTTAFSGGYGSEDYWKEPTTYNNPNPAYTPGIPWNTNGSDSALTDWSMVPTSPVAKETTAPAAKNTSKGSSGSTSSRTALPQSAVKAPFVPAISKTPDTPDMYQWTITSPTTTTSTTDSWGNTITSPTTSTNSSWGNTITSPTTSTVDNWGNTITSPTTSTTSGSTAGTTRKVATMALPEYNEVPALGVPTRDAMRERLLAQEESALGIGEWRQSIRGGLNKIMSEGNFASRGAQMRQLFSGAGQSLGRILQSASSAARQQYNSEYQTMVNMAVEGYRGQIQQKLSVFSAAMQTYLGTMDTATSQESSQRTVQSGGNVTQTGGSSATQSGGNVKQTGGSTSTQSGGNTTQTGGSNTTQTGGGGTTFTYKGTSPENPFTNPNNPFTGGYRPPTVLNY